MGPNPVCCFKCETLAASSIEPIYVAEQFYYVNMHTYIFYFSILKKTFCEGIGFFWNDRTCWQNSHEHHMRRWRQLRLQSGLRLCHPLWEHGSIYEEKKAQCKTKISRSVRRQTWRLEVHGWNGFVVCYLVYTFASFLTCIGLIKGFKVDFLALARTSARSEDIQCWFWRDLVFSALLRAPSSHVKVKAVEMLFDTDFKVQSRV